MKNNRYELYMYDKYTGDFYNYGVLDKSVTNDFELEKLLNQHDKKIKELEVKENYFDYDNGKAIICHNKKGDFISIKFIEDTLKNMLKKRKKILKGVDEYHTVAILTIDSEIRQIKEIKKILLGAQNNESN